MPDLIPYAQRLVGQETVHTVDGRDVHAFLQVTKDYPTWVKAQIKRARLVEHRDFEVYHQKGENLAGGRPTIEYCFTFDAAKHIGMLSNTDQGHALREYFLECERRVQQTPTLGAHVAHPQTAALIQALLEADQAKQLAQAATVEARAATSEIRTVKQDVAQVKQEVGDLTARRPPDEKLTPWGYVSTSSKPWLPADVKALFHRTCKTLEAPEMFQPQGADHPWPYYTRPTLERAYTQATRQLSFLDQPLGWSRRREG